MAKLPRNEELEALVRAAPDDEERWCVLEDWLLDQHDPRSEMVTHEKAGAAPSAGRIRSKLTAYLFGEGGRALKDAVGANGWRGGYAALAEVDVPAGDPTWIQLFADAPAFALVRTLTLMLGSGRDANAVLEVLGKAPLAAGVQALIIDAPKREGVAIDAALLEPFVLLERVNFMKEGVLYAPPLERLTRMDLDPSVDELRALLVGDGRLAKLRQLHLGVVDNYTGSLLTLFDPLIAQTCAPDLKLLIMTGLPYGEKPDLEAAFAGRIKVQ